jgi:hypothetical protein
MNPKHLQIDIRDQISVDEIKLAYNKKMSNRAMYEQENTISKSTGQQFQKFYIETKDYYTTANIGSDCNDITFINKGTTNLVVANVPLFPNQSLRIQGNRGEIDTTQYQANFATSIDTGNLLIVIRKLYI